VSRSVPGRGSPARRPPRAARRSHQCSHPARLPGESAASATVFTTHGSSAARRGTPPSFLRSSPVSVYCRLILVRFTAARSSVRRARRASRPHPKLQAAAQRSLPDPSFQIRSLITFLYISNLFDAILVESFLSCQGKAEDRGDEMPDPTDVEQQAALQEFASGTSRASFMARRLSAGLLGRRGGDVAGRLSTLGGVERPGDVPRSAAEA